ncbi:transposase, partial [Neobacillus kokaensis]
MDVETVFGQIKHNRGFNRFSLRGLSKNITEWGLIFVAHNLM